MVENLVLKDFQSISKLGKFLFPVIPLEDKNLLSTGIANLYGYIILISWSIQVHFPSFSLFIYPIFYIWNTLVFVYESLLRLLKIVLK